MRERSEVIAPAQKGQFGKLPVALSVFCHNWIDKFPACGFVCRDLKAWQSVTGAPSLLWFREAGSARQRETNESWQFILSVTDRWSHGLPPWSLLEGGEGWILVDTDTTNRPLLNLKGFIIQPAEYELQHHTLKLQMIKIITNYTKYQIFMILLFIFSLYHKNLS